MKNKIEQLIERVDALEGKLKVKVEGGIDDQVRDNLVSKMETLELGVHTMKIRVQQLVRLQDRMDDFVTCFKSLIEDNVDFNDEEFEDDFGS